MRLRVNAPQVIHETIDHEVVIINLGTGTYYSLQGSGEEIWTLLDAGTDSDRLADLLVGRYEAEPADVGKAVDAFVEELRAESLIVPDQRPVEPAEPEVRLDGTKTPFEPPTLERFTEMQHLIALDPIHEVDEGQGWPHT
jgi:hypothetical protein